MSTRISGKAAAAAIIGATVVIVVGVNKVSKEQDRRHAIEERQDAESAKAGKVHVGMSAQQCRMAWGEPKRINRTSDADGNYEEWITVIPRSISRMTF